MYTLSNFNASSVASRPQIWFPEQRSGRQEVVESPRHLQPKTAQVGSLVKNGHGDVAQFSSSVKGNHKAEANAKQSKEELTTDDLPTKAFTGLGSSVGNFFGIQF